MWIDKVYFIIIAHYFQRDRKRTTTTIVPETTTNNETPVILPITEGWKSFFEIESTKRPNINIFKDIEKSFLFKPNQLSICRSHFILFFNNWYFKLFHGYSFSKCENLFASKLQSKLQETVLFSVFLSSRVLS